jgi:hypothetical protein
LSRLRAKIAGIDVDRQIADHVTRAQRELEAAVAIARRSRKTSGQRARRAERDLGQALRTLDDVSVIGGSREDPDGMSEEDRNQHYRERRERERTLRAEVQQSGVADE